MSGHDKVETNIGLLVALVILVISIGGLVEIVPLFFMNSTTEPVEGLKPYSALQLTGRDIYIREGCVGCHSQQVRTLRAETERYGHYSMAGESVFDHPFLWGSKRTGPDLARVGKKYSNEWLVAHFISPRSMVPESVMPNFPWLEKNELNISDIKERMEALRKVGVPYSLTKSEYQANVKQFGAATAKMLSIPDARKNLIAQAESGNYDGDRSRITEMDALVAYLQVLGTMVDFSKYDDDAFVKYR